jgi:hypothetical protein
MRPTLFILAIWILAQTCKSQVIYFDKMYDTCTAEKRKDSLFNSISSAELISYGYKTSMTDNQDQKLIWPSIYIVNESGKDTLYVRESVTLEGKKLDELINVLSFTAYKDSAFSITLCYNPRNAIVFRRPDNEITDVLELCFECNKAKLLLGNLRLDALCLPEFNALQGIFAQNEIKFGIE